MLISCFILSCFCTTSGALCSTLEAGRALVTPDCTGTLRGAKNRVFRFLLGEVAIKRIRRSSKWICPPAASAMISGLPESLGDVGASTDEW